MVRLHAACTGRGCDLNGRPTLRFLRALQPVCCCLRGIICVLKERFVFCIFGYQYANVWKWPPAAGVSTARESCRGHPHGHTVPTVPVWVPCALPGVNLLALVTYASEFAPLLVLPRLWLFHYSYRLRLIRVDDSHNFLLATFNQTNPFSWRSTREI